MSENISCSPDKPDIEVFSLYNGTVRVEYHDRSHRYYLVEGEARIRVPSVTTILRVVDKSGPLVGWAINCVLDELRQLIKPGVSYGEDALASFWQQAKSGATRKRNEAGAFGTAVHNRIQSGGDRFRSADLPGEDEVALCSGAAFAWLKQHHIRMVATERPIFSREHRVSGRMDGLAVVDDDLAIIDWKTSPAIYPEYLFQTAAYAAFYEEETGQRVTARWLVRLGRDGSFEAHKYGLPEQARDYEGFQAALTLYRKLEEIKQDEARDSDFPAVVHGDPGTSGGIPQASPGDAAGAGQADPGAGHGDGLLVESAARG